MKELLKIFFNSLMAMILGVNYLDTSEKTFVPEKYYQEEIGQEPDYRSLYQVGNSTNSIGEEACDRNNKMLVGDRKAVRLNGCDGIAPYATTDSNVMNYVNNVSRNKDGYYVFNVPKGTEILAPYKCTLVNESISKYNDVYPDSDYSLGVNICINTEPNANGEEFRITYGSLERTWCCRGKTKPSAYAKDSTHKDGNKDKPYYQHTYEVSGNTVFQQKDVLGIAGLTGVPQTDRNKDTVCIVMYIEKKTEFGYSEATIEDLYKDVK